MQPKFEVGDRVKLKTGERLLTVRENTLKNLGLSTFRYGQPRSTTPSEFSGYVKCTYETPTGYATETFHQDQLEHYQANS